MKNYLKKINLTDIKLLKDALKMANKEIKEWEKFKRLMENKIKRLTSPKEK